MKFFMNVKLLEGISTMFFYFLLLLYHADTHEVKAY
jgi:hypothetical protein